MTTPRDRVLMSSGSWRGVAVPAGWPAWILPFTIEQRGRMFRPKNFNLQTYAAVPVTVTYYVDKAATGAGTGADWTNALTTLGAALAKVDVDRIYIKAGYYFWNESGSGGVVVPDRSLEIIGVGGPVYVTNDARNTCGAFTKVDNHYRANQANTIYDVYDKTILDSLGSYTRLAKVTSEAEVDATPGTWWNNAGSFYVRLADDRAADTGILQVAPGYGISITRDSRRYYFEGIDFLGGINGLIALPASLTGELYVYAKNCKFRYIFNKNGIDLAGVTEGIFQSCVCSGGTTLDGFSYAAKYGIVPRVIEMDCESYTHGTGAAHQCSSAHDAMNIVRIGGKYHHSAGHNISDVGSGYSWLLGCELYSSTSGYGINQTQLKTWLDCCWIHDNPTQDAAGNIYARSLNSGGVFGSPVIPY